jgi:predicted TIM-barrel fold metal-dependent hydrolase
MSETTNIIVDEKNRYRLETPGHQGWRRTAHPDDPGKYLMISADTHANEPGHLWFERIDKKYRDRLPHEEVDEKGEKWMVTEGGMRSRVRTKLDSPVPPDGEDRIRGKAGRDPLDRIRDHRRDGIDAEIIFPNKGLQMWWTRDAEFGAAQCRVWNDWAWETFGKYNDFMSPVASIMTADVNLAIEEIRRVAKLGFRAVHPALQAGVRSARRTRPELQLRRLRSDVGGSPGLRYPSHIPCLDGPRPARRAQGRRRDSQLRLSFARANHRAGREHMRLGVLERFSKIRFAAVESGIGWVPWALTAMDEAYRKHHLWVQPKLKKLPSEYFRSNGGATFQEDPAGLQLAETWNLVDNFMWANDYPHAEGTWPHSAEAIEREMGGLKEESRDKILGMNAARIFKFDVDLLLKRRETTVN